MPCFPPTVAVSVAGFFSGLVVSVPRWPRTEAAVAMRYSSSGLGNAFRVKGSVHSDVGLDHLSGIEDPVESDVPMALSCSTAYLTPHQGQQVGVDEVSKPECRDEA